MNDELVGILELKQNQMRFQYDENWLHSKRGRPISLSLPLQTQTHKGDKVHAYFENLLPDNTNIRQRIVDRLGAASLHPFELLRIVGADCIGALTFIDEKDPVHSKEPGCEPIDESEIAAILKKAASGQVLGMEADEDFRISLAGAQEKTALTFWNGQWCKPYGTMPTTHILKLPIQSNEQFGPNLGSSVENEWFCLQLLDNMGFDVAKSTIECFEDQKVLAVERFDRCKVQDKLYRLPQEDFCQALGITSGSKYEDHGGPGIHDIMELLANSLEPQLDRESFMRAQVVFWLLAAIDAHAKNYSIFLNKDGFKMTPFYDVLSASPYFGQEKIQSKKIKMAMALNGKNRHYHWEQIQRRHFISTAKLVRFSEQKMNEILGLVIDEFPQAMDKTIMALPEGFPIEVVEPIEKYAKSKIARLVYTPNHS